MKIEHISSYRDGGTVGIRLSGVDKNLLVDLDLPIVPKYRENEEDIYEVFRKFNHNSSEITKYYFGDINGEYKQIFLDNLILVGVKKLLEEEKIKRGFYLIEKFLISL